MPWKLHDVGQRLLLADKKTEEGRGESVEGAVAAALVGEGWNGWFVERWMGSAPDRRATSRRAASRKRARLARIFPSNHRRPRRRRARLPFVRRFMTKEREFLERIALSGRALHHRVLSPCAFVHASRDLSNDRGKQSDDGRQRGTGGGTGKLTVEGPLCGIEIFAKKLESTIDDFTRNHTRIAQVIAR